VIGQLHGLLPPRPPHGHHHDAAFKGRHHLQQDGCVQPWREGHQDL